MDKILMLRKEGQVGARGIYIGMRRQAPELGPMRYAYAWPARDITPPSTRHHPDACSQSGTAWSSVDIPCIFHFLSIGTVILISGRRWAAGIGIGGSVSGRLAH